MILKAYLYFEMAMNFGQSSAQFCQFNWPKPKKSPYEEIEGHPVYTVSDRAEQESVRFFFVKLLL